MEDFQHCVEPISIVDEAQRERLRLMCYVNNYGARQSSPFMIESQKQFRSLRMEIC